MRKRTKPKMDAAGDRTIEGGRDEKTSWKRILLLIVAITIHNIPGNGNKVLKSHSTAAPQSHRKLSYFHLAGSFYVCCICLSAGYFKTQKLSTDFQNFLGENWDMVVKYWWLVQCKRFFINVC